MGSKYASNHASWGKWAKLDIHNQSQTSINICSKFGQRLSGLVRRWGYSVDICGWSSSNVLVKYHDVPVFNVQSTYYIILSAYCHPIAMKNKTWISQDDSNPICTEILALPPATNCCRDHLILPVSTQPCPRLVRCCQRCSTCCQRGDLSQSLDGYVREVWINMGTERARVYFQQKWDVTHKPGAASNM